ncbi:MAG: InlB B-repeat-containing protein, partial [Oscillospiraceae bacterium]|nr:InlB B-repeat-containing protein [Oscillospiraceae bacterium]
AGVNHAEYDVVYGTAAADMPVPEEPVREGYTFKGWQGIPPTMPAKDTTVTANWAINQYTITFADTGDTVIAPITQNYNTDIEVPEDPTKTGYTFNGWSPAVPAKMPAEDMTVTAQWTINQYTITFDTDGGSTVNSITQDYDTAITAPENPTKTGYTFAGWDKEIPATMPAENVTIKAKWTINQYTITFNTDGGTEVAPITQDYATDVTAPANPTKTGYTFDGWDKEIPATMPAENVTITAKWKINQYTITFNTDGGSEVAPITQNYATDVTAPANPTKTGYTFNGWDKEIPATMPAENVTITAKWTINQYKVTFLDAEGGVFSESTLDYGTPIAAPADSPAKEFYNFEGWSLDGATVVTDLGTVPADNVTITPIYTRVEVTLTIVGGSTTVIDKSNATPPVTGYIYGLETRLTQAKLLDQYIDVVGDGRLVVTPTKYKVCGTGAKVEVIDNVTDTVVETYYIIIFGDINGDASIDASDTSMLGSEAVGITNWSSDAVDSEGKTNYDYCKVLAGDTNKDGVINATDKSNLTDVTLYLAEYDQQTGVITPYAG